MKKFWFFLPVVFIASCGPGLQEEVTETFDDGTPKRVKYFTGDGEDRYLKMETFFYDNGNKRVEGEYNEEGKKDGKWTYWYRDGKKWSEGYFTDGVNDKKRTTWHETGNVHYEGNYDKGDRVGVWKFYNEKGELVKELDYDSQPE